MTSGKTKTGFQYQITDDRLNNFELLELLGDLEESPAVMPKVIKLLLGKDQANKLKDHVRLKSGIVPADKIGEELKDIFDSADDLKKSESSPE